MADFRRAYVYLISAISLVIVAVGLVNVLEIGVIHLWNAIASTNLFDETADDVRRRLSLNLALLGVALPVLVLHGYLAERWCRESEDGSDRGSALRAIYFAAALGISLLIAGTTLTMMLETSLERLVGMSVFVSAREGVVAGVTVTVAAAVWATHVWLRHRDMRLVALPQRGSWPVRAYLYGVMFVGAFMLLTGVAELVSVLIEELVAGGWGFFEFGWVDYMIPAPIARTIVGGLIWSLHWSYSLRLLRREDSAGRDERVSTLRRVYLFGLLFIGIVVTLSAATVLLHELIQSLFGMRRPDTLSLVNPVAFILSFGALWLLHRRWSQHELGNVSGSEGRDSARRLHGYMVALVGLVMGSIGLGYVAGVTLEFMLDATGIGEGGTLWADSEATAFVAMILIGAAVWAPIWFRVQRYSGQALQIERQAASRRAYLYVVLAFSILALLASVATLLYQILQILMGLSSFSDVLSDLPILLGVVLVAATTVAYHLRCLIGDIRARAEGEAPIAVEVPVVTRATLVLESTSAESIDQFIATTRDRVPEGIVLQSVSIETSVPDPKSPSDPSDPEQRPDVRLPEPPPLPSGTGG